MKKNQRRRTTVASVSAFKQQKQKPKDKGRAKRKIGRVESIANRVREMPAITKFRRAARMSTRFLASLSICFALFREKCQRPADGGVYESTGDAGRRPCETESCNESHSNDEPVSVLTIAN